MSKKIIPSLLLAALLAGKAQAGIVSDSLRTTIYYRTANARLELPYMDNDRHLAALGDSIRSLGADPAVVLRRILIQGPPLPTVTRSTTRNSPGNVARICGII